MYTLFDDEMMYKMSHLEIKQYKLIANHLDNHFNDFVLENFH